MSGGSRDCTYLLHDASLPLGECDVAARFVANKLDLDLAALTAALLVIIVVVVHSASALALDATALDNIDAVANGLTLVQISRRSLIVLIRDIGHVVGIERTDALVGTLAKAKGSRRSTLMRNGVGGREVEKEEEGPTRKRCGERRERDEARPQKGLARTKHASASRTCEM